MTKKKGYRVKQLSFNRRAVISSATVTKDKSTIHCFTEIDITEPRKRIKEYLEKTGEKLSLTVSFDHDIVDGAPASSFMNQLTGIIKSGHLIVMD